MAARGLLNYGDDALDECVKALLHDERPILSGCDTGEDLGSDIRTVWDAHNHGEEFRRQDGCLLPGLSHWLRGYIIQGREDEECDGGLMTLPRALAALKHEELTVRLQAFAWLEKLGVVFDTGPLLEAWPRMSEAGSRQRACCIAAAARRSRSPSRRLRRDPQATGPRQRIRVDRESDYSKRMAELGSPLVHDAALRLIDELIAEKPAPERGQPIPVEAFEALATCAQPSDFDRALEWTRSADERTREGGLRRAGCLGRSACDRGGHTVHARRDRQQTVRVCSKARTAYDPPEP